MKTIEEIIEAINTLGAARELSESDAGAIARAALAVNQQPHVIWSVADILSEIMDQDGSDGLTDEQVQAWAERAADTSHYRQLSDCTDGMWENVREAINETGSED